MSIPRPEYPRPQLVREKWQNLNGEWQFCIDNGKSGRARKLFEADSLDGTITVPFCPESVLSGVGYKDFMPAVWYRRGFTMPDDWKGQRIILHFGAVDYDTEVWVNGVSAGKHRGGYTSFQMEITPFLHDCKNVITVCAEDDTRSLLQPTGKQSMEYDSFACLYTRTTGIWQTVWLESVPDAFISKLKLTPNLENGSLHISAVIYNAAPGMTLEATACLDGNDAGCVFTHVSGGMVETTLTIKPDMVQAWKPGNPTLYDLHLTLEGVGIKDEVDSYFGLRSLGIRGRALLFNGKPLFQRLVLDQGFYPDGIYTAPTDDALRGDIELSMAMGFNGARLHQKVFEERFFYWADKLGYLVWGEMASWGLDITNANGLERFQTEWLEVLERDYSHPSIVGWCPFNETNNIQDPEVLRQIYRITKQIDPTRPCIDTSGYVHAGLTDIHDVHDYEQDPEAFASHYRDRLPSQDEIFRPVEIPCAERPVQPYFVSEYGGIWWNPGQQDEESWGYGNRPKSEEEFIARYKGLTEALLSNPDMCAFCY
ncbi:MAG: glycoside hydrolase family 2 protein, partial [Armatimonadota bacterium]